jgi:beta-ribofuranosylaminobenzene 5'-phosphate synthase
MMTVVAPCRLHFGLFHVPVDGLTHWPDGTPVRKFGGLGMMVREPCIRAKVIRDQIDNSLDIPPGSLSKRAAEFSKVVYQSLSVMGLSQFLICADGPAEHTGLGVGTSLGMAVSLSGFLGMGGRLFLGDIEPVARVVERGKRSGIGIHGFHRGGFIVDDGKLEDQLPQLRERIEVPPDWRVVLVRPPVPGTWHGEQERTAFHRTRSPEAALDTTRRLLNIANEMLIPALKVSDFETFATSLTDFNRIAGEPFNDDQGGPYAGPAVAGIIDELIEWGTLGVGQSSWGPTVFAFARNELEAQAMAKRLWDRFPNLADVTVTPPDNQGVRILKD